MTPRYVSTRGGTEPVRFQDALLAGLAPDGGLFVPTTIPPLADGWRDAAAFPALAHRVLAPWLIDDVGDAAQRGILAAALDFPVPLVPLENAWGGIHVLELFHGPTLSFKDFGARTMARLMAHFLPPGERLTILVATSGDTGSAVADGFAGVAGIRVVLLYPKGQVSPVQERQLIVRRPGVRALAVEGVFDDCQRLVKAAFADEKLAGVRLSSANSINVGRLLPQMLYYVWAVREGGFDAVDVVVPSGNLGNLTAGVLAALAGLPVQTFVAAHNANDFFPRFLQGDAAGFAPSIPTRSNAMDVGAPSNFERLQALLPADRLRARIKGVSMTDAETLQSMRRVHDEAGYLADPHTAVGLEAARRHRQARGSKTPLIVLATAHPAKFPETVLEALGATPEPPDRLAALWDREAEVTTIPPTLDALRSHVLAG